MRALAILAMFVALSTPALGQTPPHQEILGFKLGQAAPEFTDVTNLPDVLGEDIARDMTGFMMVEQPKGAGAYHVISDGRTSPYRLRIRAPSFAHMQTLPALCEGGLLSDLLAVIGAMDYVLADVDR